MKIKSLNTVTEAAPIKVLLYGEPGVGKTSFALTASNSILIDFDNGSHRAMKINPNSLVGTVENYKELLESVRSGDLNKFDTIIIDTVGSLQSLIVEHVRTLGNNKFWSDTTLNLTQAGWGAVKSCMKELFNLLKSKGKNIILIAHQRAKDQETGGIKMISPEIQGGSFALIMQEVDFIGYCTSSNGRRMIRFELSNEFYSKDCAGLGTIDITAKNLEYPITMNELFQRMRSGFNKISEEVRQVAAVINEFISAIEVASTLEELNQVGERIKNEVTNEFIKLQLKHPYKDKYKALENGKV